MPTITRALLVLRTRARATCEVGEGVISAAIAVLIMAFIGALMWVGFKAIWEDAEQQTGEQIQQIGS